jgi:hypothetical protein
MPCKPLFESGPFEMVGRQMDSAVQIAEQINDSRFSLLKNKIRLIGLQIFYNRKAVNINPGQVAGIVLLVLFHKK